MWLKSGYLEHEIYHETIQGTQQGGVISPLLANIGLHGLETAIKAIPYRYRDGAKSPRGMGTIRYADDFIITANSQEYILEAKGVVEKWLEDRNLKLSQEKTRIVHVEDGFDFLGFNIRTYREKTLIKPSKAKVLAFCKDLGLIIKVKRRQRMGRNRWARGSKYYVVAETQKWKCSVCGEDLLNDEELATHHIVPVKDGGTDDHWNLIHLHKACHIQEHTKTKIQANRVLAGR
jgi:5-methylcytosine-specific restriction endonuclease McrA